MKVGRIASVSLLLVAMSATLSFGAELNQVVRALEQGYNTLRDLHADFSQKSSLKMMKREEKGGGELFIKKGGGKEAMFRFNYYKPKQQIVSNGKKVWYYLPDQKQVMVMDLAQLFQEGSGGVAINYLTGMGHVSRDFNIVFASQPRDQKGNYILELTPKKPSAAMAKLQLVVENSAVEELVSKGETRTPFPIVSSTVFDHAGNATRMDYSNVKTNQGIDSSRFNFKIPAGVEVVKR